MQRRPSTTSHRVWTRIHYIRRARGAGKAAHLCLQIHLPLPAVRNNMPFSGWNFSGGARRDKGKGVARRTGSTLDSPGNAQQAEPSNLTAPDSKGIWRYVCGFTEYYESTGDNNGTVSHNLIPLSGMTRELTQQGLQGTFHWWDALVGCGAHSKFLRRIAEYAHTSDAIRAA